MPTNKHKRKASAHSKFKVAKNSKSSLITSMSHPKAYLLVGLFFIILSMYLLIFESQDNAMFGLAMLSFIVGVIATFYPKLVVTKNKKG
jgi:1,4-dihydroxy-2-naphthoate octaprenyltransferase